MIISFTNVIGAIQSLVKRVITDNLKIWLGFETSQHLGLEQVINGDFSTDSDWNLGTGWDIDEANNKATHTGTGGIIKQALSDLIVGKDYVASVTLNSIGDTSLSNTSFQIRNNADTASVAQLLSSSGDILPNRINYLTLNFTATQVNNIIRVFSEDDIFVTDFSIKQLTQITPDKSGNNNVGELFTGKAINFDGSSDYIDVSGFSMSGSVSTFAFWINSNDTLGRMIDINPNRFIISFDNNQLSLYDGSWKNFGTINTNVWNRCVILTSGTSAKCYVNGVQLGGEKTITALNIGSATAAIIGANYVHSGSFFDGEMSDFQIYNAYWSTDDIAYDYANPQKLVTDRSGTSIALSNLKAYWAMSEGAGSAAYDSSGQGNNGTINGALYFVSQPRIPQLGMMNWSKGSNSLTFSEDFSNSVWTKGTGTSVTGGFTDPLGGNTAYKASYDGVGSQPYIFDDLNNTTNIRSIWGRTVSGTGQIHLTSHNSNSNSLFNLTTEWQRVSAIPTSAAGLSNYYLVDFRGSSDLTEVLVWGAQIDDSTTLGNYRLTNGLATSNSTVIPNPNNTSQDILGNAVRDRLNSFNLDGTGYAEVADDDDLDFGTGDFTLECWLRIDGNTDRRLLDKRNTTSGYTLYLTGSNVLKLELNDGTGNSDFNLTSSLNSNTWLHLAIVCDRSANATCYVNKAAQTPVSISSKNGNIDSTSNLIVGADAPDGLSLFSTDIISDLRLYKGKLLSVDEVENNYNAGLSAHTN